MRFWFWWQGSPTTTTPDRCIVNLTGEYEPILSFTGAYETVLNAVGEYRPSLESTVTHCPSEQ